MKLRDLKALLALLRANGVSRYKARGIELDLARTAEPLAPLAPAVKREPPRPAPVAAELEAMGIRLEHVEAARLAAGAD
jgi:hypothetical protein